MALALSPIAIATPTASTQQACTDIAVALPGKVQYPSLLNVSDYQQLVHYWSTALQSLYPACVVLPTSASDVAVAVKVLNSYPDVRFAVKSGGHDPNPGHATAEDGILIAMSKLVGATYDAERRVALVKPGGSWDNVIGDLEPSGVAVVGGRLGIVGVGGYLLQGGISFLSAQYGLGADVRRVHSNFDSIISDPVYRTS